jgi:ABC-2 type transport system permease protein
MPDSAQYIKKGRDTRSKGSSAHKPLSMRIPQERKGIYSKLKGHLNARLACELLRENRLSYALTHLKRSFAIIKKNAKIYYLKGPVIVFGLIFPLFLLLAYTIGRNMPLEELLPGLIGMTTFFTSTSVGPSIMPWETRSKTLERLVCCPIPLWAILLGDIFSSFIFGLGISLLPLLFALTLQIGFLKFFTLFSALILATFCFSILSVLLSTYPPTDVPATTMMFSSLVKFPLVFISGVFVPLEQLPLWGRMIASFSPLTYFTDSARHIILNSGCYPLILDFSIVAIFTIVFLVTTIKLHEKTLTKRLS